MTRRRVAAHESVSSTRPLPNVLERKAAPRRHHRQLPSDERFRPQPGHFGQYLGAARGVDAHHPKRRPLCKYAPRYAGAHAAGRRIWRLGRPRQAFKRMALPSRYYARAPRCRRHRTLPPDLVHGAGHAAPADTGLALYDRSVRRPGRALHGLCVLWHERIVRFGGRRAGRPLWRFARQSWRHHCRPQPRKCDGANGGVGNIGQDALRGAQHRSPGYSARCRGLSHCRALQNLWRRARRAKTGPPQSQGASGQS